MTPATYTATLPIALLLIVFLVKLTACKPLSVLEIWRAAMEVPVDISVFGVSTLISFIMVLGNGGGLAEALFMLLFFLMLKILSIVIWRQSLVVLERGPLKAWSLSGIVIGTSFNFFFTIMMAMYSVALLVGGEHVGV